MQVKTAKIIKMIKIFVYITIVFRNSCLVESTMFTPTPVSVPTWNVYQNGLLIFRYLNY
jgi:hypothetical protein